MIQQRVALCQHLVRHIAIVLRAKKLVLCCQRILSKVQLLLAVRASTHYLSHGLDVGFKYRMVHLAQSVLGYTQNAVIQYIELALKIEYNFINYFH